LVGSAMSVGINVAVGDSTVGSDVTGGSANASTAKASIAITPLTGTMRNVCEPMLKLSEIRAPNTASGAVLLTVWTVPRQLQARMLQRRVLDEDDVDT